MYIYTQDKKKIVKFQKLVVQKNTFGSANEKYCIVAYTTVEDLSDGIIGYYPDESSAMNELRNIYMALNLGSSVYEVK